MLQPGFTMSYWQICVYVKTSVLSTQLLWDCCSSSFCFVMFVTFITDLDTHSSLELTFDCKSHDISLVCPCKCKILTVCTFDIKKQRRITLVDDWAQDGLKLERYEWLFRTGRRLFCVSTLKELWWFVPLREACWQKHQLRGHGGLPRPPPDRRPTEEIGLTCRDDVVIKIKERKNAKGRKNYEREWGSLFPEICFLSKVKEKDKESDHPRERGRAEGEEEMQDHRTDSWGLCYLNIDWWGLSQAWDRISALAAEPKRL